MITSSDLRKSFLEFFEQRGHSVVKSSTVVPADDPTLLFTNAGMNQFKSIFLGLEPPKSPRTCSVQKCIRASGKHNDLEDVGTDGSHHTFFEMMGNWSFGDYYKREAIEWAWEFATEKLMLSEHSLWVSIYKDDDEAYEIWRSVVGIDDGRIVRLGDVEKGNEENFWSMGETGPCGPCSELHYDYNPSGHTTFEEGDENGDICELWNLVFMEYNRESGGSLVELPAKHIDTGMGLERTLAVLQGKRSNYETDLFVPIIEKIFELSNLRKNDHIVSFQVIADHIRSLAFAIADGAVPSNEGRGYVLRRILRRAVRHGKLLGLGRPFLYELVHPLVTIMKDPYTELIEREETIRRIIKNEEALFLRTLDRGLSEFERTVEKLKAGNETVFPGEEAFLLHDTYGFPYDLTQLMARERGLTLDGGGFERRMQEQRTRAKLDAKFKAEPGQGEWKRVKEDETTVFLGYEQARVSDMRLVKFTEKEDEVLLVFDRTPFYGESGGQVGDTGYVEAKGVRIEIVDTKKAGDVTVHVGRIETGSLEPDTITLVFEGFVDMERRRRIAANHTATHLMHHALREVVGTHANQAGSLVSPDRLRFDFNHYGPLSVEQIERIEEIVNKSVRENLEVNVLNDIPIEEARGMGAVALFGEKYSEKVRVVKIERLGAELCGGTHVDRTGDIGIFSIVKEGSISSGVRRIEAVTGSAALERFKADGRILQQAASLLRTGPEGIVEGVTRLIERVSELERALKKEKKKEAQSKFDLQKDTVRAGRFELVHIELPGLSPNELREVSDGVRSGMKMGVIFITAAGKNRLSCLLAVTDDAVSVGLDAGSLFGEIAPLFKGKGGGRPHLAQGGGSDPSGCKKAFERLIEIVEKM
ncbi:MAG: alanine--tRNA ligase [Spirochaetes bacterium]|nr:alanine--tRNA ligase [Spirochaetota bacterium]